MTPATAPPLSRPSRSAPPERTSFYDEPASRRRHARWWSLAVGPTAILTGLPLAAVLSPLVFGVTVVVPRLVDLAVPLPEALWDALRDLTAGGSVFFAAIALHFIQSVPVPA